MKYFGKIKILQFLIPKFFTNLQTKFAITRKTPTNPWDVESYFGFRIKIRLEILDKTKQLYALKTT